MTARLLIKVELKERGFRLIPAIRLLACLRMRRLALTIARRFVRVEVYVAGRLVAEVGIS